MAKFKVGEVFNYHNYKGKIMEVHNKHYTVKWISGVNPKTLDFYNLNIKFPHIGSIMEAESQLDLELTNKCIIKEALGLKDE